MKTILSIDLDFWTDGKFPARYLDSIISGVPQSARFTVHHHQNILLVTESFKRVGLLTNIDKHSDLCGDSRAQLNCGTWADKIRWRKSSQFHWVYPEAYVARWPYGDGLCDGGARDVFGENKHSWKAVSREIPQDKRCPWLPEKPTDLCAVVVCLSLEWFDNYTAESHAIDMFRRLNQKHGMKILDTEAWGEDGLFKGVPKLI